MEINILSKTENPIKTICMSARTCYNSQSKYTEENAKDFIKSLIKRGHESPLEHASITFDIKGISRACANQLTRHRMASFCQESLRYVKKKDISISDTIIPESIKKNEFAIKEYIKTINLISNTYNSFIQQGIKPEDARSILPLSFKTNITMTMNLREIRHFLSLRLSSKAQQEIRELANKIIDILRNEELFFIVEDIVSKNA